MHCFWSTKKVIFLKKVKRDVGEGHRKGSFWETIANIRCRGFGVETEMEEG